MKTMLVGLLLSVGVAYAQMPREKLTQGAVNCRWWQDAGVGTKLGFVIGFNTARFLTLDTLLADYDNDATTGEIVKGGWIRFAQNLRMATSPFML
jgi:hypothetical protein